MNFLNACSGETSFPKFLYLPRSAGGRKSSSGETSFPKFLYFPLLLCVLRLCSGETSFPKFLYCEFSREELTVVLAKPHFLSFYIKPSDG